MVDDSILVRPLHDVWADEEELKRFSRYDWQTIGERAITRPGMWLLVDESGSPSTASNVNSRLIATLNKLGDYHGFVFRGRSSDMRLDPDLGAKRGKVWIRAIRIEDQN